MRPVKSSDVRHPEPSEASSSHRKHSPLTALPARLRSRPLPPPTNSLWLRIVRRRSPLYLHLKLFAVTTLVSAFVARPFSRSRTSIADRAKRWIDESRRIRGLAPIQGRVHAVRKFLSDVKTGSRSATDFNAIRKPWEVTHVTGDWEKLYQPLPMAHNIKAATIGRVVSLRRGIQELLTRWYSRCLDLSHVRQLVAKSSQDTRRYPELSWQAQVRLPTEPSLEEVFIDERRRYMLPHFQSLLDATSQGPRLQPSDPPLIAVGGSGGGFRAMLGYAAFLDGYHSLWDITAYASGVSGSCWTLASLYTHCRLDTRSLIEHYRRVTAEEVHPMSMAAFDLVARSRRGNYFLFGPLVRKGQQGGRGAGLMDLYATLTSTYLLMPRHSRTHTSPTTQGISPQAMAWSRVYQRCGLDRGLAPLPILTATRVVLDEDGHPPAAKADQEQQHYQEQQQYQEQQHSQALPPIPDPNYTPTSAIDTAPNIATAPLPLALGRGKLRMHWWEFTPLKAGSADVRRTTASLQPSRQLPASKGIHGQGSAGSGAWVPAYAFGRPFYQGSLFPHHAPELSLSLILGHCTSAPAGPLTGYITALLSTLPRKTIMSWCLDKLNDFLLWKTWRKRWGNPIRSSQEWNPFYGLGVSDSADSADSVGSPPLRTQRGAGASESSDEEPVKTINEGLSKVQPPSAPGQASPLAAQVEVEKLTEGMLRERGSSANPLSTQAALHPQRSALDTVKKIKLIDAGVSNNLPAHVFFTPRHTSQSSIKPSIPRHDAPTMAPATQRHRHADIFIGFDASSDVQSPTVLQRVKDFGDDRGLKFWFGPESSQLVKLYWLKMLADPVVRQGKETVDLEQDLDLDTYLETMARLPPGAAPLSEADRESAEDTPLSPSDRIKRRFAPHYCVVLEGYEVAELPSSGRTRPSGRPALTYLHVPLLPHPSNPDFDPARATFSTSYNLLWKEAEAEQIFRTGRALGRGVRSVLQRRWRTDSGMCLAPCEVASSTEVASGSKL